MHHSKASTESFLNTDNAIAFVKLPTDLYKIIQKSTLQDLGTVTVDPDTHTLLLTIQVAEKVSYKLELQNNDKPSVYFSEQERSKTEFDTEAVELINYKGTCIKPDNAEIMFRESTDNPDLRTRKEEQDLKHRYDNDLSFRMDDFGTKGRTKREPRREKQDRSYLEQRIVEILTEKPRMKINELLAETREPKASLEECLKTFCDTENAKEGKVYFLKKAYASSSSQMKGSTPIKKVKM